MPRSTWGVWAAIPVYVCLIAFATLGSAQLVEDGLIGYWSFDPGRVAGKTVIDGTGNNDAQIMGSVPLVAGIIGDAVEFDGNVENFVSVDNPETFDFNLSFSWSAWINTTNGAPSSPSPKGRGRTAWARRRSSFRADHLRSTRAGSVSLGASPRSTTASGTMLASRSRLSTAGTPSSSTSTAQSMG